MKRGLMACEAKGHLWKEKADPENGISTLSCRRCGTVPLKSSLPAVCYGKVPEKRAIVMFERGFDGYRSASHVTKGRTSQKLVDELNSEMSVSKAQAAAMLAGATQGWATSVADPKNYDEQGQPIKLRRPDRGDAR